MIAQFQAERLVHDALHEDFGLAGDLTTEAVVPETVRTQASLVAREGGVIAGLQLARTAFQVLDPDCVFTAQVGDGERVSSNTALAHVEGAASAILSAERVALNFLGHLSGIATMTRAYVDKVTDTRAAICCTRKTLPGLRAVQKYAVRMGGGMSHRYGLDDAMLIKDNHIAIAGGVAQAITRAKARAGHMVKIEVEVDTLEQLDIVLDHAVDAVLLDNMPLKTLSEAVRRVAGKLSTEASGGVTLVDDRASNFKCRAARPAESRSSRVSRFRSRVS